MKIGAIGYNHNHSADFVMDRPDGPGTWLLLLIKTPAFFEIAGASYRVRKNSFVLLGGKTPCHYRAAGELYTDDWIYLSTEEGDAQMLSARGIPTDRPVFLGSLEELSELVHILTYEHASDDVFHPEIEAAYLEIFLLKLSRLLQTHVALSTNVFNEKHAELTRLRATFFATPGNVPPIEIIAASFGMSVSGFQHLYKRKFGVNVLTDIINGRIAYAKHLLCSTRLSIEAIAESCGYHSGYHFMRQFKQHCGMTPTCFRTDSR